MERVLRDRRSTFGRASNRFRRDLEHGAARSVRRWKTASLSASLDVLARAVAVVARWRFRMREPRSARPRRAVREPIRLRGTWEWQFAEFSGKNGRSNRT